MNGSQALENIVERRGMVEWTYRFEGTQLIVEGSVGGCEVGQIGIYEAHLLEDGNLKILTIEDECAFRVGKIAGRPDEGITREFEPVP